MSHISWYDLRKIIEEAQIDGRVIKYYKSKDGFTNTISICDFSLPRREKLRRTAAGHEADWYRDSYVCNAGWLDGWIPLRDEAAQWDVDKQKWEIKPIRGARATLQALLDHKSIRRTETIDRLLRGY